VKECVEEVVGVEVDKADDKTNQTDYVIQLATCSKLGELPNYHTKQVFSEQSPKRHAAKLCRQNP
jgi:hypothetical protein